MNIPALSVIVPIYNEEVLLPELCRRLSVTLEKLTLTYEIILVNDGSSDNTEKVIREQNNLNAHIKYISFSRNFGHQSALSAGIDFSRGEALITIDGDLQDPPELIASLYAKLQEGYKVVYARRVARKGESVLKKGTASVFYRLMKRITHVDIPVDTGDFRIISRTVIDHLKQMNEYNKFLRGQVAWIGFRQTFVEYEREARKAGESKYSFLKMLNLALDGITGFSRFPLKIPGLAGLFLLFLSGCGFLLLLAFYFFMGKHFPALYWFAAGFLMVSGIQFICIGILAEYISRITNNSNNRPQYIIEKTNL